MQPDGVLPALALAVLATLVLGLASAPIWPLLQRTLVFGGVLP